MNTAPDGPILPDAGIVPGRPLRPRELQDALNFHLYHPLSWRLARFLAKTPVTPNMVSVAGAFFVLAAAFSYAQPGWPLPAIAGLLLHMTWHVVDGADGDLARMTGRSSPVGELVDGICDYSSHIVLYLVLGYLLQLQFGPAIWLLTVSSGVSHIIQSNHFEVQRRQYQWRVYGVAWLGSTKNDERTSEGGFGALRSGYLRLAGKLFSSANERIDSAIQQAEGDPSRLHDLREIVRRQSASVLSRANMLSANHRTIALGISMLAGSPLYYLMYQLIALNLVMWRSIRAQDAAASETLAKFHQLPNTLR